MFNNHHQTKGNTCSFLRKDLHQTSTNIDNRYLEAYFICSIYFTQPLLTHQPPTTTRTPRADTSAACDWLNCRSWAEVAIHCSWVCDICITCDRPRLAEGPSMFLLGRGKHDKNSRNMSETLIDKRETCDFVVSFLFKSILATYCHK